VFTSEIDLAELPTISSPRGLTPDVLLSEASVEFTVSAFSGSTCPPTRRTRRFGNSDSFTLERGIDGDHLVTFGEAAIFHLDPQAARVLCAPSLDEPVVRRFLLDTVCTIVALSRGYEALHAGAVEGVEGVLAVMATEGGGKSTVIGALIEGGARLFSDDVLVLRAGARGRVEACPGPPLMNMSLASPSRISASRTIARFAGETWIRVEHGATSERELSALFVLDRTDHSPLHIERCQRSAAELLRHSLQSGGGRDRLQRRFALLCDLAESVPTWQVTAPMQARPTDITALMVGAVRSSDR
jgi:hypothetical protein